MALVGLTPVKEGEEDRQTEQEESQTAAQFQELSGNTDESSQAKAI